MHTTLLPLYIKFTILNQNNNLQIYNSKGSLEWFLEYYNPSAPNPRPDIPSVQGQQHVSCRDFHMQWEFVIGSHVLGGPHPLLLYLKSE